ncbi:PREDICTED: CMT1A duplicated region transcript 1 protein [Myotis davidii]|uniref:CMT1A duplicated region transcript 1 protein n=1 Tax=Myotis davidii TaxID=225400 RepID=UPI0007674353|nr:PREDICTED: CMT1A duplicated region transcript 1 protein [Myotis davidii]
MDNMESRLKTVPYFHCEKGNESVPVCQRCETCILARKIFSTKEWFLRVSEIAQRRFLVSILGQLDSLYLLYYFQNILQTTQGKDFIYTRSRIDLSKQEGDIMKFMNQMLDRTIEQKMREILYWFGSSTHRTKANYTLLLLQMCDQKLLLTAANVITVLFQREQDTILELGQDPNLMLLFPEKYYNPQLDTSNVYWTARTQSTSFPLSKDSGGKSLLKNVGWEASNTEGQWRSSLQCISEMNSLYSRKAHMLKAGYTSSNLLVDLDVVRDLSSGASKYRDFIRQLPIHISKYILSMLDKNTLNRCAAVSQHWAALAKKVRRDFSIHLFIHNQIALLQGSYTKGIDPTYACKLFVPVPKMTDDIKRVRAKNPKWKLRTKNDNNLWTAYQNQETQQIQMEERNVFCGTYNIHILSDTWDRNRIIHYSGGDVVAVSSNRKIQLLDVSQAKEIPVQFRGHTGSIHALFVCEEENVLLSGSYDLSIRSWDLKSGACIRIFTGHQGTITCIDLYKEMLVSGAKDCQVKEWDINTGKCLKTFKHKDPILAIKINDTYIVSSCERGIVKVWHIVMAQVVKILSGHEGAVKCLCFDQWHLLSGSVDGLVMAWSMVGKYERCLMAYKHPKMVINTESNILLFQFENIKWQYFLERAKQRKTRDKEDREENLPEVMSKASTPIHNLGSSISNKYLVAQESLLSKSHKSRVLLLPSRTITGLIELCTYYGFFINLNLAGSLEVPQSQTKLKSPRRDGDSKMRVSAVSKEVISSDSEQESQQAKSLSGDDMEKVPKKGQLETFGHRPKHSRRKSWKISMSPDRFLLTVNALQQAHTSGKYAYPHRTKSQVIDVWEPSISHPRKVLSFKGKSLQHAVDTLRVSHPPIDVKQTNISLEIQKLQPNLKNSLHDSRVQSSIPQPMIIRSRISGSLKIEDQVTITSSIDGAVRSFRPLTSLHVIKANHMVAPQVDMTTQPVKKERPCYCPALDPFRMNSEFMLLTVREEKEYQEAKLKEYQATKPTEVVNPERARKAAWIRKIKGLPIDDFMKQGKTAAPELGPNVFI